MSISRVQGTLGQTFGSGTTTSVALVSPVAAGDMLIVTVGAFGLVNTDTITISDDKSNGYSNVFSPVVTVNNNAGYGIATYYILNVANSPQNITVTVNNPRTNLSIFVDEWRGISAFGSGSISAQNTIGTGTNAVTSNLVTPITGGNLIYGFSISTSGSGLNAGSGFAVSQFVAPSFYSESLIQVNAAPISATYTANATDNTITYALAFKPTTPAVTIPAISTGTSSDIVSRVKALIPNRWFRFVAPYRDAILGALADMAAWNYSWILYARAQTRMATAYGIWLDILAYDFLGRFLVRNGIADDTFRALIRATILQERVTRSGMVRALTALTGNPPTIFEPWNTMDTGAYSSPGHSGAVQCPMFGYGVGKGGYGNMMLNDQAFVQVIRGSGSGVPGVGGYGNTIAGYGVGAMEYLGPTSELWGITDAMIYDMINKTKPTGTTIWVQYQVPILSLISESGIALRDESGTLILVSR